MRRTLYGLLSESISFAALVAFLLVGLHVALERGHLTARIEAALEQKLGRSVSLGPISLRPAPEAAVSIHGVRIANLPSGSRPEFVCIGRIDFEFALRPLMEGRIQISTVVMTGADILLERDGAGNPNWQFDALSRTTVAPDAAATWFQPELSIGDVQIEDARVRIPAGPSGDIEIPRLALRNPSPSGSRALSGTIKALGETIDLAAEIGPVTTLPLPLDATLSLAGASVSVRGNVPVDALSQPGWSLAVAGTAEDPRRLLGLLPGTSGLPAVGSSTFALQLGPGTPYPTLTDIRLRIGAVDLTTWLSGLRLNSAEIVTPAMDKPVTMTATASRGGVPVAVSATLGPPPLLLANNRPLPIEAKLTTAGAVLTLKGTMVKPFGAPGSAFDATLIAADLDRLSPLLVSDLPDLHGVNAASRIEQTGPASFSLQRFLLSADGIDASGDLQVGTAPRLSLRGRVAARRLDLDKLVDAVGGQAAAPARSGRVIPDIALPLSTLRSFDATLAFSADAITAGGMPWRAITGNLELKGGRLTVAPLMGSTAGGSLRGRFTLDAVATPPTASVLLQNDGRGFDVSAFREAAGSKQGLAGPAEIVVNLKGHATTTRTFAATLNGDVGIAMVGGRAFGIAPVSVGPDLSRLLLPRGTPSGGIALDCVAVRLSATNGIVKSQALLLQGPDIRIEGDLGLDLRDELLVMRLLPDIRVLGVTVRAPVGIEGPLAAPRIETKPGEAFARLMADTVSNRLWRSSAVEWLRRRVGGAPGAHTCAAQLRVARLGRDGPVPKPPAVLPGLPQEVQGAARNTFRSLGNLFRGRQ